MHPRERGTWSLDQVGVNAPGRPTRITFLSLMRSFRFNAVGGHDAASTWREGGGTCARLSGVCSSKQKAES